MQSDEQHALLRHARDAIAARLGKRPLPAAPVHGALARPCGAFVTLRLDGRLRGCVGFVDPGQPLGQAVGVCAADAATRDPRFPPLPVTALQDVILEISVLSPLTVIDDPALIEVGRHGLAVGHGARRGLMLPQVPIEWGWDRETFLSQTCAKAGLAPDAWRSGATVYVFEAVVFDEAG